MSRKFNILIVEDSDDDYEVTMRAIKKSGFSSDSFFRCESGEEALDFLSCEDAHTDEEKPPLPNLILLDLNIPGKDGKAVLSEIKGNDRLKSIPVIIVTTSDNEKDIQRCYALGANSYMQKKVDLDAFFQAVSCLMEYWSDVMLLPQRGGQ